MRIGFLTDANVARLDWAQRNGFGSIEWMEFDASFAAPGQQIWRPFVDRFGGEAQIRNLRISAIGALYQNPPAPFSSAPSKRPRTSA